MPQHDHNQEEAPSILQDLGEEVTGIIAPVSLCMAVTVLLVRVLNPEGTSNPNSVYIASIAYDEKSDDSSGQKLGGALLNAIIFACIIGAMTIVLFILFKYGCYKIIFGYMAFAVFNIFFFLTGALLIELMKVTNVHIDAFSFCFALYNFSIVGVAGILFVPVPLFLKQCYLVWVGIITAYIFTWIPEWTTWVLLCIMAIYDIVAVLMPGGPLKALVELAIEREQELPALIYEARPAGRGYQRGFWNRQRQQQAEQEQAMQAERAAGSGSASGNGSGNHVAVLGDGACPPGFPNTSSVAPGGPRPVAEGRATRDFHEMAVRPSSPGSTRSSSSHTVTPHVHMTQVQPQPQPQPPSSRLPPATSTFVPAMPHMPHITSVSAAPAAVGNSNRGVSRAATAATAEGVGQWVDEEGMLPGQAAAGGQCGGSQRSSQPGGLPGPGPVGEGREGREGEEDSSALLGPWAALPSGAGVQEGSRASTPPQQQGRQQLQTSPDMNTPLIPASVYEPSVGAPRTNSASGESQLHVTRASSRTRSAGASNPSLLSAPTPLHPTDGAAAAAPTVGGSSLNNSTATGVIVAVGIPVAAGGTAAMSSPGTLGGSGAVPGAPTTAPMVQQLDVELAGADGTGVSSPGAAGRRYAADGYINEVDIPDAIKLGLGDFIFYSMLVGRAAMYDFMTVFASYLAIIAGLGLTLLCLAVWHRALPALPFSIALGVLFYFVTRLSLEPFLVPLATHGAFF